jgi:hypothetical protein
MVAGRDVLAGVGEGIAVALETRAEQRLPSTSWPILSAAAIFLA